MINYADTVTMYYNITKPHQPNIKFNKPWRFNKNSKDIYLHHWFIKLDKMYLSYYPNMYGATRLFVTYSLPKLLKGHNTFNIMDFDINSFYMLIMDELSVFPWKDVSYNKPTSFKDWECSRIDLFIMHPIPYEQIDDYMNAYELLTLSQYHRVKYENTCYINSSLRPDKKSNKVIRAYPKMREIKDRMSAEYPKDVNKKHDYFLQINEPVSEYYRFEFMLRRPIIKYECKRNNIPTNMYEIFQQPFQEQLLSKMISAIGLDRKILRKNDFKDEIKKIFPTEKVRDNALNFARAIRKKQKAPLTYNQIQRIKSALKKNNIHYITHKYFNINPVKFP